MAENTEQKPVAIPLSQWIDAEPARAVPVAGLLAAQPELSDKEKTPDAWTKALAAYLKTPIDPEPTS